MEREPEKEKPYPYAVPATYSFLKESIKQGLCEDLTIRNRNIVGTYYSSAATLEDIHNQYKISRQRVRRIIFNSLIRMWEKSSEDIKIDYPIAQVLKRKPVSGQMGRRLEKQLEILRLARKTAGIVKIATELNIPFSTVSNIIAREVRSSNLVRRKPFSTRLEARLNKLPERLELRQKVLNMVNASILNKDRKKFFISFTHVCKAASVQNPLSIDYKDLSDFLKKHGIAAGYILDKAENHYVTYFYVFKQDFEKAVEAVGDYKPKRKSFEWDKTKRIVERLCSPPEPFYERQEVMDEVGIHMYIRHRELFITVREVFNSLGIKYPRGKIDDVVQFLKSKEVASKKLKTSNGSDYAFILKSDLKRLVNLS